MWRLVNIGTNKHIFQYKILNSVLYLNEKRFKSRIISSPLCSFCYPEDEPRYTFLTLEIKHNLSSLSSKSSNLTLT